MLRRCRSLVLVGKAGIKAYEDLLSASLGNLKYYNIEVFSKSSFPKLQHFIFSHDVLKLFRAVHLFQICIYLLRY